MQLSVLATSLPGSLAEAIAEIVSLGFECIDLVGEAERSEVDVEPRILLANPQQRVDRPFQPGEVALEAAYVVVHGTDAVDRGLDRDGHRGWQVLVHVAEDLARRLVDEPGRDGIGRDVDRSTITIADRSGVVSQSDAVGAADRWHKSLAKGLDGLTALVSNPESKV